MKAVDHATPWLNSFVTVNKKQIEKPLLPIPLDPCDFNQATVREPFYFRTSDDIFHKLSQAKMFTIVYFSMGYHHIELDEASSFPTTLNTPFGRFRFTSTPLGLTVVGEAFQCKLDTISNNLDFCTGIADDVVMWDEETDGSDHDNHLANLLQTTRLCNLKLDLDKLQFKNKQASSFGITFTTIGHKPENKRTVSHQ